MCSDWVQERRKAETETRAESLASKVRQDRVLGWFISRIWANFSGGGVTKALLYNIYNRSYILYKGVFFIFFLFFRGKKLLYIYIYVCVNKKKKKNEKVISQCSQTALFRVKWSKIEFLFFFLDGSGRFLSLRGGHTPENEGRQARARTDKAAILSFWRVLFCSMINCIPERRKWLSREIGLKIRGAQNLHICEKSSNFAAEF